MIKITLFIFLLILSNCSFKKVVQHHGVHNLEKKQTDLIINSTNKNDIIKLIGPPSTKSTFDNDIYIYIERKTSSSKLTKLGKKKLLLNNVLVLEVNNKGILMSKQFYNKDDMKDIKIAGDSTKDAYNRNAFIYDFLSSMRQKMNDPLGQRAKKRKEISQR